MASSKTLSEAHESGSADQRAHTGWLLQAFPEPSQLYIFFRAVMVTAAILGVEYIIEVVMLDLDHWQNTAGVEQGTVLGMEYHWEVQGYFTSPDVLLSACGLVFALVVLGQWGARYVKLWEDVRPAFDVPKERYDAAIRRNLKDLYGRDHIPFLLFVGFQLMVYTLFDLPAGFFHVGFFHFFAAMAIYVFYHHTVTIGRVTDIELVDFAEARSVLSEIADFSVVVSLSWFAALAALGVWFGVFLQQDLAVGLFYIFVIACFVGIGLLAFHIRELLVVTAVAKIGRLHPTDGSGSSGVIPR